MAYIGKIPAAAAITASDLDPAVITGQTALAVAPADTDEFLISDAGVLKRLDASLLGGGKLLQAVSVLNNTESNTTSGSYQLTGLTANITPSATSSKVLAIASFAAQGDGGAPAYTLYNGSAYASGSSGRGLCNFEQTGKLTNCGFNFLDSPSSTSQVTYTVVMKNNTAGQNAIIAPGAAYGHLTLLEIGA
jgi:hypothetical protein